MKDEFARQRIEMQRLPPVLLAKWPKEVLEEGFVPFPKRLLRCLPRIFSGPRAIEDLAVVLAVVDFKREKLSRLPSLDYLAFVAGMDEPAFRARLLSLRDRDLVQVDLDAVEGVDVDLSGLVRAILSYTQEA